MALIFYMSSENSEISSHSSGTVIRRIAWLLSEEFRISAEAQKLEIISVYQHFVRKAAHFSVYFSLGFCAFGFFNSYNAGIKKKCLFAWIFSAFYAATDEFHQLFIAGRSGEIKDVMLDSLGAATGIAFFVLIVFIIRKIRGLNYAAGKQTTT